MPLLLFLIPCAKHMTASANFCRSFKLMLATNDNAQIYVFSFVCGTFMNTFTTSVLVEFWLKGLEMWSTIFHWWHSIMSISFSCGKDYIRLVMINFSLLFSMQSVILYPTISRNPFLMGVYNIKSISRQNFKVLTPAVKLRLGKSNSHSNIISR